MKEKNIEDYFHFYYGCECEFVLTESKKVLIQELLGIALDYYFLDVYKKKNPIYDSIKPILRPLSSMTEEEAIYLANLIQYDGDSFIWKVRLKDELQIVIDGVRNSDYRTVTIAYDWKFSVCDTDEYGNGYSGENPHETTRYLLSKSFDLFGLIESGLAIESPQTISQ